MSQAAAVTNRSSQLAREFEDLLRAGDAEQFLRSVADHCSDSAKSPWDVLAVIDQLYRRGKLAPQLFRLARIGIERRALGFPEGFGLRGNLPGATGTPVPEPQTLREQQRQRAELAQSRLQAAAESAPRPQAQPQSPPISPPQAQAPTRMPRPVAPPLRRITPRSLAPRPAGRRWFASTLWIWLVGGAVVAAAIAALLLLNLPPSSPPDEVPALPSPPATPNVAAPPPETPVVPVAASEALIVPREPGVLSLEQDRYVVSPAERQVAITVRRTGGTDGELSLEWGATNGGAKSGRDFTAPARATLTLAHGQDSAQLVIPILRNAERRYTEYFEVRLLRGAGTEAVRRATVFILPGAGGAQARPAARAGAPVLPKRVSAATGTP